MFPEEIQQKFVKAIAPYKEYFDQFESALLLHNIPLFVALAGIVLGYIIVLSFLYCKLSSAVVLIILVPLLELLYCFDVHIHIKKLFKPLPTLDEKDPKRIRTPEEIMKFLWKPILLIWRAGFFVYRTFRCPNPVDTIAFIFIS
jgi:phosphatidylglycerophosphatase A